MSNYVTNMYFSHATGTQWCIGSNRVIALCMLIMAVYTLCTPFAETRALEPILLLLLVCESHMAMSNYVTNMYFSHATGTQWCIGSDRVIALCMLIMAVCTLCTPFAETRALEPILWLLLVWESHMAMSNSGTNMYFSHATGTQWCIGSNRVIALCTCVC